jgi:hypothetical protein
LSRAPADRPAPRRGTAPAGPPDPLVGFLIARLTEDLARIWTRGEGGSERRPGMAAQVDVIDGLLTTLQCGGLPGRPDLRILLYGYGTHPGYDPRWTAQLP